MAADSGGNLTEIRESIERATSQIKERIDGSLKQFGAEVDSKIKRSQEEADARINQAIDSLVKKGEIQKTVNDLIEASRARDLVLGVGRNGGLMSDFDMARLRRSATETLDNRQSRELYEEFLTSKPSNAVVERFHYLSARLTMMRAWMRRGNRDWWPALSRNINVKRWWDEYRQIQTEIFPDEFLARAFDTATATEGLEWVPTLLSSELVRYLEVRGSLIPAFRNFPMPTGVYDVPISTSANPAHVLAERTAAPSGAYDYTIADLYGSAPTANIRFDAITMRAFIVASRQFIEESIVPMIDFAIQDTSDAIRRAIEDAMINGDAAPPPHFDTRPTISYTATAAGTLHRRTAWNGFRWSIEQTTRNVVSHGGAATITDITNLVATQALLGRYGVDSPGSLLWIAGLRTYLKLFNVSQYQTMDKVGTRAVVITGQLGELLGNPLIVNEFVRDDLDTNGVGTTTTNNLCEILCVHRPSWWLGNFRGIETESERLAAWDQDVIWARWRGDFKKMRAAAERSESALVNIGR